MSIRISEVSALEILDSRGRPTLEVTVVLDAGVRAVAGVPSGASTGTREAVERRDGDAERYAGAGVTGAVAAVNGEIADALRGAQWAELAAVDDALIALDGTDTKERLGANAIVGVSMAVARAMAESVGQPLYRWLGDADVERRLPVPHFNVVNGGAHAQNPLAFQEFMLAPVGAPDVREALRVGAEIYGRLRALLRDRGLSTGLGDEGGFAPDLATAPEVLDLLVAAIDAAGYDAGPSGVAIALDPAASEFCTDGVYHVSDDEDLSARDMVDLYAELVDRYPIWSIEDGLAEDDWTGWRHLTDRLGRQVQLVGDDIFVTNPAIITRAIDEGVGTAALIKLNQIGTVTETLEAMRVCRRAGYAQMVSHRSGETPDTFIADLAVATGCGQLKSGAPARGERVAKYNRLVAIEHDTDLPYGLTSTT
jgi:enolase